MSDEMRTVYKYVKTNTTVSIILSFLIIAVGIVGIISFGAPGIAAIVLGVCIILFCLYKDKTMKDQLLNLCKDEQEAAVLSDFNEGKRYFKDKLIVGDTFVMGAKTGVIRKISDIQNVYQSIHRTNGLEAWRNVVIKSLDSNGQIKKEILCHLQTKSMLKDKAPNDNELVEVVKQMVSVNPDIKLGNK